VRHGGEDVLPELLHLPLLRHVLGGSEHPHRRPAVPDDAAATQDDPLVPGRADDAMLERERPSVLRRMSDRLVREVAIVGVDEFEVSVVVQRPQGRLAAEDSVELVGPAHDVAPHVPLPAADVGERLRLPQS
jgi:hypothetical protein